MCAQSRSSPISFERLWGQSVVAREGYYPRRRKFCQKCWDKLALPVRRHPSERKHEPDQSENSSGYGPPGACRVKIKSTQ